MTAGSVNSAAWRTVLSGDPAGRDARGAKAWDDMTAYIKRSTDDQLRAGNPGLCDEDIARWRLQAAGRNPWKGGRGMDEDDLENGMRVVYTRLGRKGTIRFLVDTVMLELDNGDTYEVAGFADVRPGDLEPIEETS